MAALLGMLGGAGGGSGGLGAGAGAGGSAGPSSASGVVGNVSISVGSGGVSNAANPLTNLGQLLQLFNQGSNVTNNLNGTNAFAGLMNPYDNPTIDQQAALIAPSQQTNWSNWILIGGAALAVVLLIMKKH